MSDFILWAKVIGFFAFFFTLGGLLVGWKPHTHQQEINDAANDDSWSVMSANTPFSDDDSTSNLFEDDYARGMWDPTSIYYDIQHDD